MPLFQARTSSVLAFLLLVLFASPATAVRIERDVLVPLSTARLTTSFNGQIEFLSIPHPTFPVATVGVGDEFVLNVLFAEGKRLEMIDLGSGADELVQPFVSDSAGTDLRIDSSRVSLALLFPAGDMVTSSLSFSTGSGGCCMAISRVQNHTNSAASFRGFTASWIVDSATAGFPAVFNDHFLRVRADELRIISAPVPEPGSALLLGSGLAWLAARRGPLRRARI